MIEFEEDSIDIENRIMNTSRNRGDEAGASLRPQTLEEYTGQEKVKGNLKVCIDAAKLRGEPLDHILLYGPPGLGKTTLSTIIANEMSSNIRITSGPTIEKAGDLVALLTNLQEGDILFIDEIHRIPRTVEEVLYSAMEDFEIDIIIGKGPAARSFRMPVAKFTLIGATTRAGLLSNPLRDRFGIRLKMELYTPDELALIVKRSASILGYPISPDGARKIAVCSRGTPRIANRLLKRVRDFAQVNGNGVIDEKVTAYALSSLEIDELGLDNVDRRLLSTIIKLYDGGPVGLDTLSATIGEDAGTLEDVYEPYLLQIGFVSRTPRGRCATKLAYEHLGLEYRPADFIPAKDQTSIFDEEL